MLSRVFFGIQSVTSGFLVVGSTFPQRNLGGVSVVVGVVSVPSGDGILGIYSSYSAGVGLLGSGGVGLDRSRGLVDCNFQKGARL